MQSNEISDSNKHRRTSSDKPLDEDLKPSPTVSQKSPNSLGGSQAASSSVVVAEHMEMSNHDKLSGAFCADEFSQSTNAGKSWLVIEIFAGSCRLSKACKDVGFRATAVDKVKSRSENFTIYQCDLGDPLQLKLLKEYLAAEADSLVHAHFAPSCGTASRAREKRIPNVPLHRQPRPLRSELPNLSPKEKERVRLANISYDATMELIDFLVGLGVSCSVENPSNSLFWKYVTIRRGLAAIGGLLTAFHSCMHGGARDKSTTFWSHNPRSKDVNLFESLSVFCDGSHQHAPWVPKNLQGKMHYPTSEETAYPVILCQRIAHILKCEAVARGFSFPDSMQHQLEHDLDTGKRQLFANQSRHQHLKPLVSEFSSYQPFVIDVAHSSEVTVLMAKLPRGSKVCSRRTLQGVWSRDELQKEHHNAIFAPSWHDGSVTELVQVGIPKDPEVFLKDAVRAGHPRDMLARAPDTVVKLLGDLVNKPLHCRLEKRAKFFKKWLKRSLELKEEEAKLHDELPEHLRRLLVGKRLLLWKEILTDLHYPDVSVVDDIVKGFPITGWSKKTGVFQTNVRKPDYGVDQLIKRSKGLNAAVVKSLDGEPWTDVDVKVWEETMLELERGWISEPIPQSFEFVAKRFGLVQKNKVRMIDDFTICGVNGAFGLKEKLRVQSVDELSSYLAMVMNDPGFPAKLNLVGRTYDLKSAYKQFGVDVFHSNHCRVGVKSPEGDVKRFSVNALPFGATGSVAAFLRIAASVSYIALVGLQVVLTNFFDDFTVVCDSEECNSVDFYLTGLFRLLGLEYASEGDKAPPFSDSFGSLGILFNLTQLRDGFFTLEHTDRRREELLSCVDELMKLDRCHAKELEKLHGRLVWFGSFVFGRQMNVALRTLNRYAHSQSRTIAVSGELKDTLTAIKGRLLSAVPAKVSKSISQTWIIFTDGAYEPTSAISASIGGVLVDPGGTVVQFFGEQVNSSLLADFESASNHPIYELEVLPVLVATAVWADLIKHSQVVYYIDNEAAKSAFIQGVGFTDVAKSITSLFDSLETRLCIISWFGRVASHSNLSDGPSRLQFGSHLLANAVRVPLKLPHHVSDLGNGFG